MAKKLISGDRNWSNTDLIAEEMVSWPEGTELVHGDAAGADTIARSCAGLIDMKQHPFPYLRQFGRAGGPIRNTQMLDENPDIDEVVAFHDDITRSKGTKNMLEQALRRGIKCRLITTAGEVPVPVELHPKSEKRRKRK